MSLGELLSPLLILRAVELVDLLADGVRLTSAITDEHLKQFHHLFLEDEAAVGLLQDRPQKKMQFVRFTMLVLDIAIMATGPKWPGTIKSVDRGEIDRIVWLGALQEVTNPMPRELVDAKRHGLLEQRHDFRLDIVRISQRWQGIEISSLASRLFNRVDDHLLLIHASQTK